MSSGNGLETMEARVSRLEHRLERESSALLAELRALKEMVLQTRADIAKAHTEAMSSIKTLHDGMPKRRKR